MKTFDEIVELYEADPVKFLEGILPGLRYEGVISDECVACRSWDEINHTEPCHITRKNHAKDGMLPWPHRFVRDTAFYPLSVMSKEQVLHRIKQLRRSRRRADEANLMGLYYREKFIRPRVS